MNYLSICSGIEAASVAWHSLGWKAVGFSEIEPFPCSVLAHRFPTVPNYGDMTKYEQWPLQPGSVDLLVGGTPCQSFSVAGLRKGLEDPRGNLMLTFLGIAARFQPRWVVWENVPGVLSSGSGRDFGAFLGALGQLGYGYAYRVLDAQYIRVGNWPQAVPQRRRRVFVVGCLGDYTGPGKVLAIEEGLRGHIAAQSTTRKEATEDVEGSVGNNRWWDGSPCASTLTKSNANGAQRMPDKANFGAVIQPIVGALTARGPDSCGRPALDAGHVFPAVFRKSKRAQSATDDESWVQAETSNTVNAFDTGERDTHAVATAMTVRRLTPLECERLQGFPDDWTLVPHRGKPAADGPRYKALGNSMACNCMAWIGERIAQYEQEDK